MSSRSILVTIDFAAARKDAGLAAKLPEGILPINLKEVPVPCSGYYQTLMR